MSVQFSDYEWIIKEHLDNPKGPRENYWSSENVCVQKNGKLKMSISKSGERWFASEIYLDRRLGYGTYSFTVKSPLDDLDPNAVLGLFLYENDHQEIDIEVASHIDQTGQNNAAFTIQPIGPMKDPSQRLFNISSSGLTVFSIKWTQDSVIFKAADKEGNILSEHPEDDINKIPVASGELARINYFLFNPSEGLEGGKKHSILISDFNFIPEQ